MKKSNLQRILFLLLIVCIGALNLSPTTTIASESDVECCSGETIDLNTRTNEINVFVPITGLFEVVVCTPSATLQSYLIHHFSSGAFFTKKTHLRLNEIKSQCASFNSEKQLNGVILYSIRSLRI